jgi:hypothetical protein
MYIDNPSERKRKIGKNRNEGRKRIGVTTQAYKNG